MKVRFFAEPDCKQVAELDLTCVPKRKDTVHCGTKRYKVTQVHWVMRPDTLVNVDVFVKKD